jgi:drug/metabolite transporter (DMT)-like permease
MAATNTYVNPVFAVFLGWMFNNEIITGQTVLAGGLLLLGVWFINSAKRNKKPEPVLE